MRLWDSSKVTVDEAVLEFTVGNDPTLDLQLLPFDCLASAAHAMALWEIGILAEPDMDALRAALREAYELSSQGQLPIHQDQEDSHTALEAFLVERTGGPGRKIHTGRSRNDQVIQALRLLLRERLLEVAEVGLEMAEAAINLHDRYHNALMPGYTHTRQAMPSTVGQLFGAFAEGCLRDIELLIVPLQSCQRSALGSASGYGVPLPLARETVRRLLGLDALDENTIHAQNMRGRLEAEVIFALHQASLSHSRLAADLIHFSSEAYGFFRLPVAMTTGSSIMPQKRNPDVLELIRAVPSSMSARYIEVTGLLHGLQSGYHRDLQRTKSPVLEAVAESRRVQTLMAATLKEVEVDEVRCRAALEDSTFATDRVYRRVRHGVAFRDAYREEKDSASDGEQLDDAEVLGARTHPGAPGTNQSKSLERLASGVRAKLQPFRDGALMATYLLREPASPERARGQ